MSGIRPDGWYTSKQLEREMDFANHKEALKWLKKWEVPFVCTKGNNHCVAFRGSDYCHAIQKEFDDKFRDLHDEMWDDVDEPKEDDDAS